MSLSNPNKPVTEERLQEFYHKIVPYMGGAGGGGSYTAGDGIDITEDVISTKQSEEGDIDEIIDVYPQAGNLVSIVNAFNRGDIYSTDEKMIGQWIDGKPLYQRTVDVGSVSAGTDVTYSLSGWNIDVIVKLGGNGYASYGQWVEIGFPHQMIEKYGVNALYNESTQSIIVHSGTDCSLTKCFITIQYTKTTDTAISIGSETEYSTDEKVVGTWIDGSPVYQKTISCGALPNATSKATSTGISNIDKVVYIEGIAFGDTSPTASMPIPHIEGNAGISCYYNAGINSIVVINKDNSWTSLKAYVTLQYTKTTT